MTLDSVNGNKGNHNFDNGDPVIPLYLKKGLRHLSKNEPFFHLVIRVNSHFECCNIDRFYHPIFFLPFSSFSSPTFFISNWLRSYVVISCRRMSSHYRKKTHTQIHLVERAANFVAVERHIPFDS